MKHSTKPWRVRTDRYGRPEHVVNDAGETICSFLTSVKRMCGTEQIAANATLITGSPDLLAALQGIMAGVAGVQKDPIYEAARAAIQKATGAA